MKCPGDDPIRAELDGFVRAYELAYARDGRAEIAEFLPPADSPLYVTVLRELIRVDLEYGWERGCPKTLSEYQHAFPVLLRDRDGLREIALEESRLRRQAEDDPAPDGPRRRAGATAISGPSRRRAGDGPGRRARRRVDPSGAPAGDDVDRSGHEGMERVACAYREFRMHHDEHDFASLESWCASLPDHFSHARLFRDIHLSDPRAADRLARGLTSLPGVGKDFLGFRLIGELGRGAFGRVYLARQGDLADRPVALKVSPQLFDESQSLAQLQHTNIVPIYSIHRFEPFQAVCMPYFGSTTLKDVYDVLVNQGAPPTSGRSLLIALNHRKSSARCRGNAGLTETAAVKVSSPVAEDTPAGAAAESQSGRSTNPTRLLDRLTYVQAILWIAARLADGLAHAHERGIVHRDLKPANILLTDEGQPMLLDFNLSASRSVPSGAAAVGGTLPYMAPEHLDAFRGGARPVDARSDLYSFGIILYELLTGRRPFPNPPGPSDGMIESLIKDRLGPPPDLRRWNKAVTPAVESIVHHCLEPDPGRRYQTARELHEDLERHLADRPLRHAPEPSWRERLAKWARRHPTLCSSASIALLALILITSLGAVSWLLARDLDGASARLHRGAFRTVFTECQLLLNTNGGPSESLDRGVRLARQALDGYGVGGPGDWTVAPLVRRLPAAEQWTLREEVSELVQLEARACITLAERTGSKDDLRRSLQRGVASLDRAERFDPRPSSALYEDRGQYNAALGRHRQAARDHALALRVPPTSARDFYLLGTSLLARGQLDRAELPLSRAIALDARRFWAWFALGICHSDQGRHLDAAHDFSVCTTLAPEFAWTHLNRGLALARSGRLPEARVAYDRALEISPDFAEALVDRALTCLELGDPTQASRDLDRAIALGRRAPAVLTVRAEALSRLGRRAEAERAFAAAIHADPKDPIPLVARGYSRLSADRAGAEADFARAQALDPLNARIRLGRAYLLRHDDPRAALTQVESALEVDPGFGDALQLRALLRARLGDPAAEADVDRLLLTPTPQRLYNAACALSLLSRSADAHPRLITRAFDLLQRAIDSGLPPACLTDDPDLDALRRSPLRPGSAVGARSAAPRLSRSERWTPSCTSATAAGGRRGEEAGLRPRPVATSKPLRPADR